MPLLPDLSQIIGQRGQGGTDPNYQDPSTGGTGVIDPNKRIYPIGPPRLVVNQNQKVGFGRPMSPVGVAPTNAPRDYSTSPADAQTINNVFAPYTQLPSAPPQVTQHTGGWKSRLKDALVGTVLMGPAGGIASAINPQLAHNARYNLIDQPQWQRDEAFRSKLATEGLNRLQDAAAIGGIIPGTNLPTEQARYRQSQQEATEEYRQERLERTDLAREERERAARATNQLGYDNLAQRRENQMFGHARSMANLALRSVKPGEELTDEGKQFFAAIGLPITHRPEGPDIPMLIQNDEGLPQLIYPPRQLGPNRQPGNVPVTTVPGVQGKTSRADKNTMTVGEIEREARATGEQVAGPRPQVKDDPTGVRKRLREKSGQPDPQDEWNKRYKEGYDAKRKELMDKYGPKPKAAGGQYRMGTNRAGQRVRQNLQTKQIEVQGPDGKWSKQ